MMEHRKDTVIDELKRWEKRDKKNFWMVVRGITGKRYKEIKEIHEEDRPAVIECFELYYGKEKKGK